MGIINRLIIYHRGPTLYVGEWFPNGPNWAYYAWFLETVSICPYLPRWVQGGDFSARGAQPTRALHRDAKSITHRIHVLYIYGNIYHQYTPNVSIYTSTMDPMGNYDQQNTLPVGMVGPTGPSAKVSFLSLPAFAEEEMDSATMAFRHCLGGKIYRTPHNSWETPWFSAAIFTNSPWSKLELLRPWRMQQRRPLT